MIENIILILILIAVLILIIMLSVDYIALKRLDKGRVLSSKSLWLDKYYELKWRNNLLLSVSTIAAIALGAFGYSINKNLNERITNLNSSLTKFEERMDKIDGTIVEKENEVADLDSNIAALSSQQTNLRRNVTDIKSNIGKVYKDFRYEDLKRKMKEFESINNSQKVYEYLEYMTSFDLPESYYEILKRQWHNEYLGGSRSPQKREMVCLLVRNYPEIIVNDLVFMNELVSIDTSLSNLQINFRCLTNQELINFIKEVFDYIYKNEGVTNNKSRIEWLTINMAFSEFERSNLAELSLVLYKSLKTKGDRFLMFKIIRDHRLRLYQNIDSRQWNHSKSIKEYFQLLIDGYGKEFNTDKETESLNEMRTILQEKK